MNRMMLACFLACLCSISVFISTAGAWAIETVDDTADVGEYCSLATINGQPAIAYNYNYSNLRYARFNGSSWDYTTVDEDAMPLWTSLAPLPDGNPAVAYYEYNYDDLKYAWFNGSIWQNTIIDSTGITGQFPSLAMIGGQPAISYLDATLNDLKYARYNGSAWLITTIDASAMVGTATYTSLAAQPNGNPAVVYRGGGQLKYAAFNGTTWNISTVDSSSSLTGRYASLAFLPNGNPAISYYYPSTQSLRYAFYDGSAWTIQEVYKDTYSFVQAGLYSSLAVMPNGLPCIAWQRYYSEYGYTSGQLWFSWLENSNWNTVTIDESYNNTGLYCSLETMPDKKLGISYYDNYYGVLKFAKTDFPLSAAGAETHYTATVWTQRAGETVGIDEPVSTSTYLCAESGYVNSYINVKSTLPGSISGTITLSGRSCTDGTCREWDEETGECLLWGKCMAWNETGECLEWVDPIIEEPNDASGRILMQIQISATNAMPIGTPVYLHFLLSNYVEDPGLSETMYCRIYRNSILVEDLAADTELYIPAQVGDIFEIDAYCRIVGDDYYYHQINVLYNIADEEGQIIPLPGSPDICGDGFIGPDDSVNLFDFNCLAAEWLNSPCEAEGWCNNADIDRNGNVGIGDLLEMAAHWLEETGGGLPS